MKNFFENYGCYFYLALAILNFVFVYFRTKKTKGSFRDFWTSFQGFLDRFKSNSDSDDHSLEKKDSDISQSSSFDFESFFESKSLDEKIDLLKKIFTKFSETKGSDDNG